MLNTQKGCSNADREPRLVFTIPVFFLSDPAWVRLKADVHLQLVQT